MPALALYADHDSLNQAVVAALRAAGVDVTTTVDVGHELLSDDAHLSFASSAGRVLYSANRRDFARLHSVWISQGRHHSGIILRARQDLPIGEQIRGILLLVRTNDFDSMDDRLEYLESWLRRLPAQA